MKKSLKCVLAIMFALVLVAINFAIMVSADSYSKDLYKGDGFTLSISKGSEANNPQTLTVNVYVDGDLKVDGLVLDDVPLLNTKVELTKGYSYTSEGSGALVANGHIVFEGSSHTLTFRITTKKISDNITIQDGDYKYGIFSWAKPAADVAAYERNLNVYVNGEKKYTQVIYTPRILTNAYITPQFYFTPSTDKFMSAYSLNPYLSLNNLGNKDIDVNLTTRCACGRSTCKCDGGSDCHCEKNCDCDDCMAGALSANQIDTGFGIITFKDPSAQGYNLTVEVYVNGEKQYTSKQLRIKGSDESLKFAVADGYYFATGVNKYDIETKYAGSFWTYNTGFISITPGIDARDYDNRLKIYLRTFQSGFQLNVDRALGDPTRRVNGYTASYVAFDPKTNTYHSWEQTVTDFSVLQQPSLPRQTDITLTAICDEGYEVEKWTSDEYASGGLIREPDGEADNNAANGNSVIYRLNSTSLTSVIVRIASVKELPRYSLTYDVNGGTSGSGPDKETDVLAQNGYTLSTAKKPTHANSSSKKVVFIGWTAAKDSKIYAKGETKPTTITKVDIAGDTTVFAVWGYDENGNGTPDVDETLYSLTYDVNGGTTGSGPAKETGLLTQNNYTLSTAKKPTHANSSSKKVVFIGWTAAKDSKIYAKGETAPTTITTVDIAGDTTVYAAWGYDENGNGTPDVNEPLYSLTYDVNGGTSGSGPAKETGLLTQNNYTLSTAKKPTHANSSSKKVVFIGWTAAKDSKIYAKGETKPTTITKVDIEGDTTVFAVWGYDENGNGTPDVNEPLYSLTYDVNGGTSGSGPDKETDVLAQNGYTLSTAKKPTHANSSSKKVVFIGWTAAKDSKIYAKGETKPTTITTVNISADRTVFAVWGYDENGNGTPDVNEPLYSLTYDVNGGTSGSGPAKETGLLAQTGYALSTAKTPTHADADGKKVAFIGWTAAKDTKIYAKGETKPTTITTVNISADTTVFAVWGYDVNGNGTPDVTEDLYSLTYNVNGGTAGSGPAEETGLLAQTGYALSTAKTPTHADADGKKVVFIGWTAAKDSKIYAKGETMPAVIYTVDISGDTTVYAVWGYDENGNGIPDVIEDLYSLTYDLNGGIDNSGPAKVIGLLPQSDYILAISPIPAHADVDGKKVIFIGWSAEKDTKIYANGDNKPTLITTLNISADANAYAVWGYDVNGNGTPDVYEEVTSPKTNDASISFMLFALLLSSLSLAVLLSNKKRIFASED